MEQAILEAKKMKDYKVQNIDIDSQYDMWYIEALEELIERLESMKDDHLPQDDWWISVDIWMPNQGIKVMTKSKSRWEIEWYYVWFWHDTEMPRIDWVTHWQPLPLPPTT